MNYKEVTSINEIKDLISESTNVEWCCRVDTEGKDAALIYHHGLLHVFDDVYEELEHNPYTEHYGIWDAVKNLGPTSLYLFTEEEIEYVEIYGKIKSIDDDFDEPIYYFVAERIGEIKSGIEIPIKQTDQLIKLREWGFETPQFSRCDTPEKVITFCSRITKGTLEYCYPTQSVSISINNPKTTHDDFLSSVKYCIRHTVQTEIKGIQFRVNEPDNLLYQMGGFDYPVEKVAVIPFILLDEPCYIGDTYVTVLTIDHLHGINIEELCAGDIVTLRGVDNKFDVTITPNHDVDRSKHFQYPKTCEYCGKQLKVFEGEHYPRCEDGSNCIRSVGSAFRRITHTSGLNVIGIGPERVKTILSSGIIKQPLDLFSLTVEDLCKVKRIGKRTAENLVEAIAAAKETSLPQFLCAADIPPILGYYFNSLDEILNATPEDIVDKFQSRGFRDPVWCKQRGNDYYDYLKREETIKRINDLLNVGIKVVNKRRYC